MAGELDDGTELNVSRAELILGEKQDEFKKVFSPEFNIFSFS
jgi:hypothetical protein